MRKHIGSPAKRLLICDAIFGSTDSGSEHGDSRPGAVVSGQRSVVSGQRSVVSGQWSVRSPWEGEAPAEPQEVVSGQPKCSPGIPARPPHTQPRRVARLPIAQAFRVLITTEPRGGSPSLPSCCLLVVAWASARVGRRRSSLSTRRAVRVS